MLVFGALDAGQLLQVVWVSTVAGIATTLLFSLVVLFGARSAEARRGRSAAAATTYAVLAVATLVVFGALVVYGVQVMLSKG